MYFLKQGDRLPSVTTTQLLMRRHRPHATISSDGIFGPLTYNAVKAFQAQNILQSDGYVGPVTWNKAMQLGMWQTIDVVDGDDPSLIAGEAADIRAAGGVPIVVFGMSGGVEFVVQQILARARPGRVALLRLHGHGGSGSQNVTGGQLDGAPHLASISNTNFEAVQPVLSRLRTIFVGFGSVQLLGCSVGAGSAGLALVTKLALTWGVPATAATRTQYGGGGTYTFRFEGPIVTGFPTGGDLRGWSTLQQQSFGNVTMSN